MAYRAGGAGNEGERVSCAGAIYPLRALRPKPGAPVARGIGTAAAGLASQMQGTDKHIPRSCIHDGYLIGLRGIFHIKVGSCSELNLRDSPSRSFGKSRPILWKSILD